MIEYREGAAAMACFVFFTCGVKVEALKQPPCTTEVGADAPFYHVRRGTKAQTFCISATDSQVRSTQSDT